MDRVPSQSVQRTPRVSLLGRSEYAHVNVHRVTDDAALPSPHGAHRSQPIRLSGLKLLKAPVTHIVQWPQATTDKPHIGFGETEGTHMSTKPGKLTFLMITFSRHVSQPSSSNECKRRKVKCDGANPCAKCVRNSISCEYHPLPRVSAADPQSVELFHSFNSLLYCIHVLPGLLTRS